jgi:hypothetical protein
MNLDFHNPKNGNAAGPAAQGSAAGEADATLRLIAGLPAPKGLEERVHQRLNTLQKLNTLEGLSTARGLGAAPRQPGQGGRVLAWPAPASSSRGWLRAAAAAAIAFVIVGGGWDVYRHVQPGQTTGRGIMLAPRGAASGGFAGAGAVRTPQTLNGPVVNEPTAKRGVDAQPAQADEKKAGGPIDQKVGGNFGANNAKRHAAQGAKGQPPTPEKKRADTQAGVQTANP